MAAPERPSPCNAWRAGVHPSADGAEVATPLSLVEWFQDFYAEAQASEVRPVEGVVRAGELLFVPRGWWHLAMNLEVRSRGRAGRLCARAARLRVAAWRRAWPCGALANRGEHDVNRNVPTPKASP